MIAIIDYGAGNLRSISRGLMSHGVDIVVTADPEDIRSADRLVLPGVGNAKAAMQRLTDSGIADAVRSQVATGTPLLGICLGMQLLLGEQEEGPTYGLDLIPGSVRRLPADRKVPHMGWNTVAFTDHSVLSEMAHAPYYFVHSYVADPVDPADIAATTHYGAPFPSVLVRDHVWGTQFHPEKSGDAGLALLKSWLNATARSAIAP